jgi:hypothetical protein
VGVRDLRGADVPALPVVGALPGVQVHREVLTPVDELHPRAHEPVAVGPDRAVLVQDELRVPEQVEARDHADLDVVDVVLGDAAVGDELDLDRQPAGLLVLVEVDVEGRVPADVV